MGWNAVLVARIFVATEGVLWAEAVEPDLTAWWCKGWGYMGMLIGGSAMLITMDPNSYSRDMCVPIADSDCEKSDSESSVMFVRKRLSGATRGSYKSSQSHQAIAELDPPVTPSPA